MNPDADPRHPDRDGRPAHLPTVPDYALSWLRAPLTMRHLSGLGVFVVGGAIPIAVMTGGWAWLGLGVMVIIILGMAMAFERGRLRARRRPSKRARKRVRRRSAPSPRHARTRHGGRSAAGHELPMARVEPTSLRPENDRPKPGSALDGDCEPARGKAPLEHRKKRGGRPG